MLYCFDLDGTLIESFLGKRDGELVPIHPYERVKFLPGRRDRVRALLAGGHHVVVVTNQGGVAFGQQTVGQVADKMRQVRSDLGIEAGMWDGEDSDTFERAGVYVAFGHPAATVERYRTDPLDDWRKPNHGMLLAAAYAYGYSLDELLMVGDLPTDREAAVGAGVRFQWSFDFFEDPVA